MILLGTDRLQRTRRLLTRDVTAEPFLRSLDLKPEQEDHAFRRGFDGGRQLAASTIRSRSRGWGYYRRNARSRVRPSRPFGVWTGAYLRSTHEDGRYGGNVARWQTLEPRAVRNPWDIASLGDRIAGAYRRRLDAILAGRIPPTRIPLDRRTLR